MPTYEYECDACEHRFDEFQSMTEKPLKKCPKCGKPKLRRLFGTGTAIIFKGSGFYETDYRSDSYKEAAKKEQEAAKPAGTEKSGSGDAANGASPAKDSRSTKKTSKSKTKASDD